MSDPIKRLPMLPAERALKVISGRWKAIILYHLFDKHSVCPSCSDCCPTSARRC
jgi:DNA-binding HxlR family transcriptional regulator